jgi:hypothetical protein
MCHRHDTIQTRVRKVVFRDLADAVYGRIILGVYLRFETEKVGVSTHIKDDNLLGKFELRRGQISAVITCAGDQMWKQTLGASQREKTERDCG